MIKKCFAWSFWTSCDNLLKTIHGQHIWQMQFDKQHDYLLKFQVERRINKLILLWKWLKNASDAKNNAYKTPIFAYNKKSDLLVSTNSIIGSSVEEKNSTPYLEDAVINSKEKTMNLEDTTPTTIA